MGVPEACACLLAVLIAACAAAPDEAVATDALSEGLTLEQVTGARSLRPRTLALTYDDGPDTGTLELARFLAGERIPATFFINGCHLSESPEPVAGAECLASGTVDRALLGELTRLGHRVANHTEDHVSLAGIDAEAFFYQVERNQASVDPYVSDGVYLFRPPANHWDASLASWARGRSSMKKLAGPIARDVDGADWGCAREDITPEACAARYVASLAAVPTRNGIVQMHDGNAYAHGTDYALRVTRAFLAALRREREPYRFVALDAIRDVRGMAAFGAVADWSRAFADGAGWSSARSRYGSLRLGDVDHDGKSDLCARDATGIVCAKSTGRGFSSPTRWLDVDFRDDGGWDDERYGATIELGDVDGDGFADVCGRATRGMTCYFSNGRDRFEPGEVVAEGFGDDAGFGDAESRWASVRVADVNGDGKSDVCGRGSGGIVCALSRGRAGFDRTKTWLADEFGDQQAWGPTKHGSTIQFGDVDGDRRADVCGRGHAGMVCALSVAGDKFGAARPWTWKFSDDAGWDEPSRFGSIRLADIDGDGRADLCGRDAHGIECGISDGSSFTAFRFVRNDDFRDDGGWSSLATGSTIRFGDIDGDGRADLCGRGTHRIACATAPRR